MNSETDYTALYEEINSKWNVNAHYGKVGNNVRLFGDRTVDRCEIWHNSKGFDVFAGRETPLYNVVNSLLVGEWSETYTGKKSKNEIAVQHLTASDVSKILESVAIVQEKPKTKTKNTKAKNAKKENKTA